MDRPYRKSYGLFFLWLTAVGAVSVIIPLGDIPFRFFGEVKSYCILLLLLLDLLFVLMYGTERIYWMNGITYEEAAQVSSGERKRFAGLHLLCFLGATVCYILYCLANKYWMSTSSMMQDSLVAAGMICAAVLLTNKIRLNQTN